MLRPDETGPRIVTVVGYQAELLPGLLMVAGTALRLAKWGFAPQGERVASFAPQGAEQG